MLVALALLLGCNTMAEAITCNDAVSGLIPCGSYLIGQGGADPSPRCCESARALNRMASTVASRRQLCECLKQTGPSFGVKPERVQHLPPFCKIDLNMPVSPDVDCSRYVILQPSIDVECLSKSQVALQLYFVLRRTSPEAIAASWNSAAAHGGTKAGMNLLQCSSGGKGRKSNGEA
ncbi:hypothetical protein OPV22_007795 [Ensete ventricosum]|uniref:Non-specific lipid-transfer protein n=1 Tax=Ensete ventricosum TaxID=4639 RepID=A0AAV8R1G7_ENSVE|nr:hypothetical protein OPV22_007795 [Ensete ventricosum]